MGKCSNKPIPFNVLQFPAPPAPPVGNGALDAVRDYLERVHPLRAAARRGIDCGEIKPGDLPDADYFLAWLAYRGFQVVAM